MNKIVPPKFQMTAFEINYSMSMTFSMVTPVIASLGEPVPTIAICIIAGVAVVATMTMKFDKKNDKGLSKDKK